MSHNDTTENQPTAHEQRQKRSEYLGGPTQLSDMSKHSESYLCEPEFCIS